MKHTIPILLSALSVALLASVSARAEYILWFSVLDAAEIVYAESVDRRSLFYTASSCVETRLRLYELEELLDRRDFFRCSKSVILHLNKVQQLKPEITRNILATLVNGERVVISRRYAPELKKLLGIG